MRRDRRRVAIRRRTRGTEVEVELKLDSAGRAQVETPFALLNELLELMVAPSGMDLRVVQTVNKHADDTYAIDDLASAVAEAFRRILGPRPRIRQFGNAILPVGDALVLTAVDLVSPPVFQFGATFRNKRLAGLELSLIERFLATFADRLGASIHIRILSGAHDENRCRAIFVTLGRALSEACVETEREGAREFAADVDYLEGIPRPPAGPAGLEEAVVEEISGPEFAPEMDETGFADDLATGRGVRVRRVARAGRGERPAARGAEMERVGGAPRRSRAGRAAAPARADERAVPPEEARLPELPEFPGFDAPDTEAVESLEPLAAGLGTEDEESPRRRRRRGRRGGRGRRRPGEAAPAEGVEEPEEALPAAGRPAPFAPAEEPERGRPESRPWLRGWEEEPATPPRDRDAFEATPDLEPGEPAVVRAAGRPGSEPGTRFGRRSSRLPRRGGEPRGAKPAGPEEPEPEPPPTPPSPEEPAASRPAGDSEVLDYITGMKEAKAGAAAKSRRRRR